MKENLSWTRWIVTTTMLAALAGCGMKPMGMENFEGYTGAAPTSMEPAPSPTYDSMKSEEYEIINENSFVKAIDKPLSTSAVDVDTASYSIVRRSIDQGSLPPKDAVRIEELINYFSYAYPEPEDEHPFSVTSEVSSCPWNHKHRLARIGLKGKSVSMENLPPSNLVFLVDVSGSMTSRLDLVKSALRLLTQNLREQDRISIVVYAGSAGLILPPTSGNAKAKIFGALDKLKAGRSTAGGEGIQLAYKTAKENLLESGNNRVILATDGDFNVGPSSRSELLQLIQEQRKEGIFLTMLGFGMGNYKDAKVELVADKGNGLYAYIDSLPEARKVLVKEIAGMLLTIAKDVKIQVEFNPAKVESYRLIGYENRALKDEDFKDDKKDAGEIGAGHTVTALYEIVPQTTPLDADKRSLTFSETKIKPEALKSKEILKVSLRYKEPKEMKSKLLVRSVVNEERLSDISDDLRFAAAVVEFGLLLRDSPHKGDAAYENVIKVAQGARGVDKEGYRADFIKLVEAVKALVKSGKIAANDS
ncbi:von Willebrand factor type A domain-containing protein [Thermodesulfobacteriota bacterium]